MNLDQENATTAPGGESRPATPSAVPKVWDAALPMVLPLITEDARALLFDGEYGHQADADIHKFFHSNSVERHLIVVKWSLLAAAADRHAKTLQLKVKTERARLDNELRSVHPGVAGQVRLSEPQIAARVDKHPDHTAACTALYEAEAFAHLAQDVRLLFRAAIEQTMAIVDPLDGAEPAHEA